MCKKTKGLHNRIDKCMKNFIDFLKDTDEFVTHLKIRACCCGHFKYSMTIVCEDTSTGDIFDIVSCIDIPRKRNFYKKDKQGIYYIPEVVEKLNAKK